MAITRLILLVAVAAGSIAAAEPRAPTARWVVNYDDAQCVASRNYGTAEKPLLLALKPSPLGNVMRVMLIRKGPSLDTEQRPASVRFDSSQALGVNALVYGERETQSQIVAINLPMAEFASNRAAGSIQINAGPFNERLSLPALSGVMAAFNDCLTNLADVWNIGDPHSSRVKQPARARQPLRDLFNSTAYSRPAIDYGNAGNVGIALLIDETGKVDDCMIEETSGYPTLDTMSCHVITGSATFEPAVGADGKRVKSASYQQINWQIAP